MLLHCVVQSDENEIKKTLEYGYNWWRVFFLIFETFNEISILVWFIIQKISLMSDTNNKHYMQLFFFLGKNLLKNTSFLPTPQFIAMLCNPLDYNIPESRLCLLINDVL